MTLLPSNRKTMATLLASFLLSACGGGGGDSGSDGPPPPPPPSATTYTLQLTDANLQDTRSNTTIDPTGLPVTGATATRN